MELKETFERVKKASKSLALLTDTQRNDILNAVADAIVAQQARILQANAQDLAKMESALRPSATDREPSGGDRQ